MCDNGGPLVSIIMPTYNSEATIENAINSCLRQTYHNIEVIIVDDGSQDGTLSIIASFLSDDRVKFFRQVHAERSAARNYGLTVASGEYIQFLDADDELHAEKISLQAEILVNNPEIHAVYCWTEYRHVDGAVWRQKTPCHEGLVATQLLSDNFLPIHSVLARASAARFNVARNRLEDWEYWIFSLYGKKIAVIRRFLCTIVIHNHDATKYRFELALAAMDLLHRLMSDSIFQKHRTRLLASQIKYLLVLTKLVVKKYLGYE